MSSYMVSETTIDRIISGIETPSLGLGYLSLRASIDRIIKKYGYDFEEARDDKEYQYVRDRFGAALMKMNQDAVNARYQENEEPPGYSYKYMRVRAPQFLKSIHCLMYQCSVGIGAESDTYKMMKEIEYIIMYVMVTRTAEYDRAEWA